VSDTPKVLYDLEFYFTDGDEHFVTVEEGRDRMAADDERVKIELHPTDDEVIEDIIHRQHLNRMRTTKKIIKPAESKGLVQ
jgi:hypothetical protein